jgi:hypothetical protein
MLAQLTHTFVSARWREMPGPWISRLRAQPNGLARSILKRLLGIGAATLAVSTVVFLRIVLSAHLVPRWQEALAHFLPFLD